MGSWIYILTAYWPFVLGVLGIGVVVGWWAEGARDSRQVDAWLERGGEEP